FLLNSPPFSAHHLKLMNSNQQLNPDEHPSTIKRRQSMLIKLLHSTQQTIYAKSPAFCRTPRLMGSRSTNNYLCTRHPEMPLCVDSQWEEWSV
ncbi:hypothetical protein CDAR_118291, partial [Caerostris darwini]